MSPELQNGSPSLALPSSLGAPQAFYRTRLYATEAKLELIRLLRTPHYALASLVLPTLLYLLFGLTVSGPSSGGRGAAEYLLAGYGVFGAVTAALFSFGAGVAMERAQGWLTLKRATPMPLSAYLAAKVVASMLFSGLTIVLLASAAMLLGGVRLPAVAWLSLLGVVVLGCVPFCLLGLSIALVVPPSSAPGVVNLINLPLAFAGGLWVPVKTLPAAFQWIAPALPQYHLAQLAAGCIGFPSALGAGQHAAALVAAAAVLGLAARVAWRRAEAMNG